LVQVGIVLAYTEFFLVNAGFIPGYTVQELFCNTQGLSCYSIYRGLSRNAVFLVFIFMVWLEIFRLFWYLQVISRIRVDLRPVLDLAWCTVKLINSLLCFRIYSDLKFVLK
jgi:hypothetical protein